MTKKDYELIAESMHSYLTEFEKQTGVEVSRSQVMSMAGWLATDLQDKDKKFNFNKFAKIVINGL